MLFKVDVILAVPCQQPVTTPWEEIQWKSIGHKISGSENRPVSISNVSQKEKTKVFIPTICLLGSAEPFQLWLFYLPIPILAPRHFSSWNILSFILHAPLQLQDIDSRSLPFWLLLMLVMKIEGYLYNYIIHFLCTIFMTFGMEKKSYFLIRYGRQKIVTSSTIVCSKTFFFNRKRIPIFHLLSQCHLGFCFVKKEEFI